MERVPTGIPGLDKLIQGGFPKGRTVLLSGGPGTGKTTFALQFLANGALKGEPGVVISLEEDINSWRNDMLNFGIDLKSLEEANKLAIIEGGPSSFGIGGTEKYSLVPEEFDLTHTILKVANTARKIGAKRMVIDSLPALDILIEGPIRRHILKMNYMFKSVGLTTLFISEPTASSSGNTPYVANYIADSLIELSHDVDESDSKRSLLVRKMRGTAHDERLHQIKFMDGKGLVVVV